MKATAVNIVWVGMGGALGSASRYALALAVQRLSGWLFPIGTMTVNTLGCLLIGFLSIRFDAALIKDQYRLAILVGLLGGFTTFSTFSLETLQLVEQRQLVRAGLNIVGSLFLCLVSCWIGQLIGRAVASS